MSLSEFDLIARYFARRQGGREDVVVGIGDDGAVLRVPEDKELVLTTDTLVAGVHFPERTAPEDIAHKAVAANLSDVAAMGAEPAWATLALTLPEAETRWLERFSDGLFELADRHHLALVGGDMTHGPLTVTLQLAGWVAAGRALRRDGARAGDGIYVTGTLGDAAAGLLVAQGKLTGGESAHWLRRRLDRPQPRVQEGGRLVGLASAAIDVSDGLAADLNHILQASGVGARVQLERVPISEPLASAADELSQRVTDGELALAGVGPHCPPHRALALAGGDDYELCFTVPPERWEQLEQAFAYGPSPVTRIGVIEPEPGLRWQTHDGQGGCLALAGYQHF